MPIQPVEWVLVVYYGPSAHRATYGRLGRQDTKYTKDYIQLSRKSEFIDTVKRLFPVDIRGSGSVPLTFQWPTGTAPGALVFRSADRPHLKWETSRGAPLAWKMSLEPSEATAETIPGDPSHQEFSAAEKELALLESRGAGQPYLVAIKLRDEARTLHVRVYLANPSDEFAWADIQLTPEDIKDLAKSASRQSALAWSIFQSGGVAPPASINYVLKQLLASHDPDSVLETLDQDTGQALANYLRQPGYGLFFDPTRNHDAWFSPEPLPEQFAELINDLLVGLETYYPTPQPGDAAAETLEVATEEVEAFREQISRKNYKVPDSQATIKTRGSAQKAFAEAVKKNYGYRCAITSINTRDFIVASHIVPWSQDPSIRLDPSNGICLSLLVDRAFEKGYLLIDDNLTIHIDWERVGDDAVLRNYLEPYDGHVLDAPAVQEPKPAYLKRRREMAETNE